VCMRSRESAATQMAGLSNNPAMPGLSMTSR
jgi:hypothetical protein